MRNSRTIWLLLAIIAIPSTSRAQDADVGKLLDKAAALVGIPHWTVTAYGGLGSYGRMLLEAPRGVPDDRQWAVTGSGNGFSFGADVAMTILPRTSVVISGSRTTSDIQLRDDRGFGVADLSLDNVGSVSSTVASLGLIRHMFTDRAKFTPYTRLGLSLAWWNLSPDNLLAVAAPSGETMFRTGAYAALGLQYKLSKHFSLRGEGQAASLGNPFTGKTSWVAPLGVSIDEPGRVRESSFRAGVAYAFGFPKSPLSSVSKTSNRDR